MDVELGPFLFGTVEDYARGKAREYPDKGGPVILAIDVPDSIVHKAQSDRLPISHGLIQFDVGA